MINVKQTCQIALIQGQIPQKVQTCYISHMYISMRSMKNKLAKLLRYKGKYLKKYCHIISYIYISLLYLIIALPLLMYTQVFLRVQFLALYFSLCILRLCLPLLTHTVSYIIHLLMTYNYRCLLPHFTLYSILPTSLYTVMYK